MSSSLRYTGPQRTENDIFLYLSPKQPAPESVPFELEGYVGADVWSARIHAIVRAVSRYSKPALERAWAIISVFMVLIVPIILSQYLNMHVASVDENLTDGNFSLGIAEAHAIAFGVFLATALAFILPMVIWKFIGQRKINAMLRKWHQSDVAQARSDDVPMWTARSPMFTDTIILQVSIPAGKPPSPFHPDAYLPPYVSSPTDAHAVHYYSHEKRSSTLSRASSTSTLADLPLPLYSEKQGYMRYFEDVKV